MVYPGGVQRVNSKRNRHLHKHNFAYLHRISKTTAYVVWLLCRFMRISSGDPFWTLSKLSLLRSFEHSHRKMALHTCMSKT